MISGRARELIKQFLDKARSLNNDVELIKILKTNTYRIGIANVLVRVASDLGGRFFFGLNYISAEEINNLENSFIAFICGDIQQVIFLPTSILVDHLPEISHDRNGEYKINFTRDLKLVHGRGNHLDCHEFVNNWEVLNKSRFIKSSPVDPVESIHTVIQGRLLEIGNLRGYYTYCPDKSKTFNRKKLEELATLTKCPELQYTDYELLRKIDALWFRKTNGDFYPECAFEVEFTTGVWSGFGRLTTLREFKTRLYIVTHDAAKFATVRNTLAVNHGRYDLLLPDQISLLYQLEQRLLKLRQEINL